MSDRPMHENRVAPRLRSLLKGKIVYNNRLSTMDCVVRDISATGARLAITHQNVLPDRFELYVPLKEKNYSVEVRWRADEDIGVMFLTGQEPVSTPTSEPDLLARVKHLEDEVTALHDILARLMTKTELH
jgi:PilZ domain